MLDGDIMVLGYWDGMLSGQFVRDGSYHYFDLIDGDLYPEAGKRRYHVWRLEARMTPNQVSDRNWRPGYEPTEEIDESELRKFRLVE